MFFVAFNIARYSSHQNVVVSKSLRLEVHKKAQNFIFGITYKKFKRENYAKKRLPYQLFGKYKMYNYAKIIVPKTPRTLCFFAEITVQARRPSLSSRTQSQEKPRRKLRDFTESFLSCQKKMIVYKLCKTFETTLSQKNQGRRSNDVHI